MLDLAFYLFSAITVGTAVMVVAARNPMHAVFFLILSFFGAAGLFLLLGAEFLAMVLVVVYVGAVAVLFLFVIMMLDLSMPPVKRDLLLRFRAMARALSGLLVYTLVSALVFSVTAIAIGFIFQPNNVFSFLFFGSGPPANGLLWGGAALISAFLASWKVGRFIVHKGFFELVLQLIKNMPLRLVVTVILAGELATIISLWKEAPMAEELTLTPMPPLAVMSNTQALGQALYTDYIYVFQTAGLILLIAMIGAIVLTLRKREGARRQNVSAQVNRRREDAVKLINIEKGRGIL